jgi:tetratricopeptide (TPR) repeat protein
MTCPELEELESYVTGRLDEPTRERVTRHVAACRDCSSQLREISEDLRILGSLREHFSPACSESAPVPREVGRYRILREIGRGASGVVYEAEQREPRRRVAVKLLGSVHGADAHTERLLQREASALARLRHPSIAAIYEAGHTPAGQPYFAMELIDGEPLDVYANRCALSLRQRLCLFATACEGVAYAHERGVIHRDLKPSNILVESGTATLGQMGTMGQTELGAPKILDFGLARILELEADLSASPEPALSETGRVFGTLPYMSPEHVRGQPQDIDVRSDVYSLGVILFELLTGRLPYVVDRGDLLRTVRVICEAPPTDPRAGVRALPDDVVAILFKSLEKEPQRRFQSAAELAADVRRFLRNEPISARPPTAWYRFHKFVRRNTALVATVAASVLLLLGTTGAAIGHAVAAARERDAAERRLELALQSANYVFFGVSGQIARVPGTGEIQRHVAEEAYAFYRRIADEKPDDPMEHAGLWAASLRLAVFAIEDGFLDRAQLLADQVRVDVERAAADHPDDPRLMLERVRVYRTLAAVSQGSGDAAEAKRFATRAFEFAGQAADWYAQHVDLNDPSVWTVPDSGPFAGRAPEHITARNDWARELVDAAGRALRAGELHTAEGHYREALDIVESLLEKDPTREPLYRQDLSDYAPLARPILLRFGTRARYESMRAEILAGLERTAVVAEEVEPEP